MPLPADSAIAVMGVTGSGKSSFIRGITGSGSAKVGFGLRSETWEIQTFRLRIPSGTISLVDMPGFDDTERADFEIIEQLVDWVQKSAANGLNLAGVLFLHPITHNRLQSSSRQMLSAFKNLLGNEYFKKVLLIKTFWNDVQLSVGEQRERESMESSDAWKAMISAGAQTERMGRDYERFIPLLESIAGSSAPRLLIQVELSQGKSIEQTMAGFVARSHMRRAGPPPSRVESHNVVE
ncbi:hypothetical protein DL765_001465 [Monosporascus sp. GIB2]|nr:hypothetical protein DL765_001465 [Monosporascus sp. GIB2]